MTARAAHRARMQTLRDEAVKVVATGACPDCGAPLRRNLALSGWYQCSQLGANPGDPAKPPCSFQCFTS